MPFRHKIMVLACCKSIENELLFDLWFGANNRHQIMIDLYCMSTFQYHRCCKNSQFVKSINPNVDGGGGTERPHYLTSHIAPKIIF